MSEQYTINDIVQCLNDMAQQLNKYRNQYTDKSYTEEQLAPNWLTIIDSIDLERNNRFTLEEMQQMIQQVYYSGMLNGKGEQCPFNHQGDWETNTEKYVNLTPPLYNAHSIEAAEQDKACPCYAEGYFDGYDSAMELGKMAEANKIYKYFYEGFKNTLTNSEETKYNNAIADNPLSFPWNEFINDIK